MKAKEKHIRYQNFLVFRLSCHIRKPRLAFKSYSWQADHDIGKTLAPMIRWVGDLINQANTGKHLTSETQQTGRYSTRIYTWANRVISHKETSHMHGRIEEMLRMLQHRGPYFRGVDNMTQAKKSELCDTTFTRTSLLKATITKTFCTSVLRT